MGSLGQPIPAEARQVPDVKSPINFVKSTQFLSPANDPPLKEEV